MALALPMLLGYYPTESLVVSALTGPRFAVGLTLRFDLDDLDPLDMAARELAQRLDAAGADAAFIAVYTDARRVAGRLPHSDLIAALLDEPSLRIRDALLVRRGRWWSYLCADQACCPRSGNRLGRQSTELSRLQTALVLSGSAVLADRSALVESIAVDPDASSAAQRRLVTGALRTVATMSPAARRSELVAVTDWLVVRSADPRAELDDRDAALVAALIGDVFARDDLLIQAVSPGRREDILRVLRVLVRRIPAPYDAPVATVLAWFAYATGDGTLANIALSRALRSDPDYSLARLIETSLDHQLPPSVLDEVLRGAARDIDARDAAG
jgi:Domain of unknown function (DUF4192)